jgi:F-type H+-transporting ATPase subunit epsilon
MFKLTIVTPEKVFCETDAKSLVAPGIDGYVGILSHHAPLITALKPGKIEYRDANDKVFILAVSGGFLEVSNNVVTLLAEDVEYASDIDIQKAQEEYDREKHRLVSAGKGETEIDLPTIRANMEKQANRIKIAKENGNR